jgi:NADPH2:quinone reductase
LPAVSAIAAQWSRRSAHLLIGTVGDAQQPASPCHQLLRRGLQIARQGDHQRRGRRHVYDSARLPSASLDCLRPLGKFASFGQSSGLPPPFTLSMLQQKGALFATRPTIMTYLAKRPDLERSATELFAVLADGTVKMAINQEWPLREAAEAHRALEGRKTTGATVLIP